MRIGLFWRVLPVHILIALVLVLPLWQRHEASAQALEAGRMAQSKLPAVSTKQYIAGAPTRIILPRLAIEVPVVPGSYDPVRKTWPVAADSANYATNTAKINNKRDLTLIYGHWTPKVFGPTKQLVTGDVAYVYTDNGHVFKYVFVNKNIIKPTDTQILNSLKGKPGMVLMTCDGNWAQSRRLMFFHMVSSR